MEYSVKKGPRAWGIIASDVGWTDQHKEVYLRNLENLVGLRDEWFKVVPIVILKTMNTEKGEGESEVSVYYTES